jgi:hypothetical protein
MIQVFHCKVSRAGQLNPKVVDMHSRVAFRVDRQALAEIFGDAAKWRDFGLSFELVTRQVPVGQSYDQALVPARRMLQNPVRALSKGLAGCAAK